LLPNRLKSFDGLRLQLNRVIERSCAGVAALRQVPLGLDI